ncbi:MAG: hypothetical protein IJ829_06840, partial [Kiritimatiellae bacterium]|nr:hypothetical protein [Kiritimatiellia bacterium]
MNKTPSVLLAVFACAAAATAEPVVPGEFTDPTNLRKATEGLSTGWFVPPEGMKFPYVSTYYVTPTVTAGDKVTIPFYVTDWNHSKVRFGDDTHRFTMRLKCVGPDGAAVERELRDVPSGDGAFTLDAPGEGEYDVGVWAVDAKGRESHRVWHRFRVMNAADVGVAKRETYAMVADDLEAYEISNEGDLGRKVLVDAETVGDADVQDVKPRDGAPGYTVFIPAPGGRVRAGSTHRSKIVYDEGYDAEAVEAAALKTLEGLQRLLDDKAAAGFHKVVLLPGTYRISAKGKIRLPDRMTLDLNGATLKENGFAGCGALMVSISAVRDAHLVNGTLEGDYYEHDYANSEKNSEWVNGFGISGSAMYCSVENVVVRDITGYGGGNGMGKGGANGGYTTFLKGVGKYVPGLLNARDGTLDASVEGCFTADYVRLPDNADRLQVSAYLGYQGIRTRQWQLLGCWYDKDKKFISSETLFQYRVVPKPAGAAYLRFTEVNSSAKVAGKDDLNLTCFNVPQNCEVKNCTFDRCRCVGYAASAMKNMLFENNLFTHSGESSAKCAFDAEDG